MFEAVNRKVPPKTVEGPLRSEFELNVLSTPKPGMVKRNWLLPAAFQLTTDSVAPPLFAAASGTMPLEVMLMTLSFSGKAVPCNGSVPDGSGVEFVPAVAASGDMTVCAEPLWVGTLTLPVVKIWKSFLSVDPLPSVVGVLDEVPPPDEELPPPDDPLPDDPLPCEVPVTPDPDELLAPPITLVAGEPPPPPPHAVRTNMLAAAAKRTAKPLLCMRSHSQAKRPYGPLSNTRMH
jgi:hypothetical protein